MSDHWIRTFEISDSLRHRKGFTVYKVTSIVYPLNDPGAKTEVVVWKRYSDFESIHKKLKELHQNLHLKSLYPSFTKAKFFGRFKADVIEERRATALSFLEFVAAQPQLFMSKPFVNFMGKSHTISMLKDVPVDQLPERVTQPFHEIQGDTLSKSSSQSTLTDTDSARSAVSSPEQTNGMVVPMNAFIPVHGHQENVASTSYPKVLSANAPKPFTSSPECVGSNLTSVPSSLASIHTSSETVIPLDIKAEEEQVGVSFQSAESSFGSMEYMTKAGYHVSQALEHETNARYEAAFVSYKNAISFLLSGIKDEPIEDHKTLIQKKATQYLVRAEHIYHNYLSFHHSTTSSITQISSSSWNKLGAPIADLQEYKVLGIVSTVILALNTRNDTPSIIKVLHKSPCPVDRRNKSIIPTNVPFMCHLYCFMENEHAVFLVLEQAKGGGLWDHIRPYFEVIGTGRGSPLNVLEPNFKEFFQNNKSSEGSRDFDMSLGQNPLLNDVPGMMTSCTLHPVESLTNSLGKELTLLDSNDCFFPDGSLPVSEGSQTKGADVPKVVTLDSNCVLKSTGDKDTESLLRNSQKLLETVSKTLYFSNDSNKLLKLHSDCNIFKSPETSFSKKTSTVLDIKTNSGRNRKRSSSRDKKCSILHQHQSRSQFSCDDMFEGRARALSHSLDREALQITSQRISTVLPIDTVSIWAAELVLALDALHRWGIVIGDLRPENLLVGRGLNLMLTYQCNWVCVDHIPHPDAIDCLYAAPEVGGIEPITPAADWWSFGAILFELLSGQTLASYHPGGIQRYSTLNLPPCITGDAESLLRQLLKFNAQDRLGGGPHGVARLKSHSFFKNIEWNNILLLSAST